MKHETTETPDAIIQRITLETAETKKLAEKYLAPLADEDRILAAGLAQGLSTMFGVMQLPLEAPAFHAALRILADTFELCGPEISIQKARLEQQAKETALQRFDSKTKH